MMATTKMTKEEAQFFVRSTKYCLKNENENANLQNKLFEIGCIWISGYKEVRNEKCIYLFVSTNLHITTASSEEIFIQSEFTEVNANDVLNIEIKDISMETLKFKVGDKVRVKSLEWYNSNKDDKGLVYIDKQGIIFDETMANLCGKIVQIEEVNKRGYFICGNVGFFEDWMLEDEVITEEEQQENKNSMEIKEMTQEEIFAYLNGTKIMCPSEEETRKFQDKIFKLGIKWKITGEKICEHLYLFHIDNNFLKFNCNIESWVKSEDRRIELNEVLAIKLKEEPKPKFDPRTLQDFDKVLVREEDTNKWRLSFFDDYEEGSFCCTDYCYKQCVPYNEETKYLKGTTEEAPEFYRI